jgi:hypothetical protein
MGKEESTKEVAIEKMWMDGDKLMASSAGSTQVLYVAGQPDRDGDVFSQECLENMVLQFNGKPKPRLGK